MIPASLQRYFWDVRPETLDLATHRRYIIERLLELGDEEAAQWLRHNYTETEIRAVLKHSRALSAKSRGYWQLVLDATQI